MQIKIAPISEEDFANWRQNRVTTYVIECLKKKRSESFYKRLGGKSIDDVAMRALRAEGYVDGIGEMIEIKTLEDLHNLKV